MQDLPLPIWNPFRAGYMENPHAQFRLLRERNPVHKAINGRRIFLRYDDVKTMLTHPALETLPISEIIKSKNRHLNDENLDVVAMSAAKWLLFLNPPEHTEMRALVAKIWNQFDLKDAIREIVEEGFDALAAKNEADLIESFAVFVPSRVICKVLGLPPADYARLRNWSYYFNRVLEPFESLNDLRVCNEKARGFYEYIAAVILEKQTAPADDFISKLLAANESLEKPKSFAEIVSLISVLFFAGIETSVNLFGQSILHLIRQPEKAREIVENEANLPRAVEELIRFISPAQITTRIAREDTEIGGEKIAAGEILLGAIAAANRDPQIFENPDELDFARAKNPHISFGYGLHYCLGAKLARDEMTISIPALFRRFPNLQLDARRAPVWDSIVVNRGLKSLPVILNN